MCLFTLSSPIEEAGVASYFLFGWWMVNQERMVGWVSQPNGQDVVEPKGGKAAKMKMLPEREGVCLAPNDL